MVDAVGISLADCQIIRQHIDDITINDIFMATTGGAGAGGDEADRNGMGVGGGDDGATPPSLLDLPLHWDE